MMNIFDLKRRKRNEDGFSLAELTVGMGVGAIVFAMAIAFLVSFNASSFKANAKSDVTNRARLTLTTVLKDISSASTLPSCAQWKNDYLAKNPSGANMKEDCLELINGSQALRVAKDNVVCWNKAVESTGSEVLFPSKMACMYKGGSGVICYDSSKTNEDIVYIAECNLNAPGTVLSGTSKIVAELGPHASAAGSNLPVRKKLFTYINYDNTIFDPAYTGKVVKVSMDAGISYENGGFKNGQKDYSVYNYSSTIQIASVRAFVEMGAYGS